MFRNLVVLISCCFSLPSYFFAAEQEEITQNVFSPCKSVLQSLSNITFITMSPMTKSAIKTELEKYGKVKEETVIKEIKEGIKVENSDSDATLMFRIEKINSADGKSLPIVQAFLSLEAPSAIVKNGKQCNAIIWASHCFFSEQSDKENDQGITMKGFSLLMKEFIKSYAEINSTKPVFLLSS
jgi:hypothetical protein